MRTWAIAILLLTSLAGCADTEPFEPTSDVPEEQPDAPTNQTVENVTEEPVHTETPAENETARLTDALALMLGNLTLGEGNGTNVTLPIGESFNMTVAYLDDDFDTSSLMWQIIFEATDGHTTSYSGSGLPANVTADLPYEGNVTIRAGATDGEDTVRVGDLQLVLAELPNDAPPPVTFSGTITFNVAGFCDTPYRFYGPEIWGWNYVVSGGFEADWWDGEDTLVASGKSGTVPAGTDNVGACWPGTSAQTSWTITVTHPDWKG